MKKYDTYLFDLYGTLASIHTDEESLSFWKKLAAYFTSKGASFNAAELKSLYKQYVLDEVGKLSSHLYEMTPGEERWPEIQLDKVFYWLYSDKFDESAPINHVLPNITEGNTDLLDWRNDFVKAVSVTPELLQSTMQYFRDCSVTHLKAYSGAEKLLKSLKDSGARVLLLSNAQRSFTENELHTIGLYDYFDDIFISSDYQCCKPDIYFYKAPIQKYNLNPSNCLMIGNDPVNDIKGAKNAGMDAFYIHSALSPKSKDPIKDAKDAGADYILSEMSLLRLQKKLLG